MKKILMIVGSMRKGSFNQQLAEHIESLIADKAEVSYLDYADLPFMNQDIEFPAPESVSRVRQEVIDADGLWFVAPEYNQSIPAVLKNMVDWLSRPMEENNPAAGKASIGKKITISGIGGANKALDSRRSLSDLCEFVGMEVVEGNGCGISFDANTFTTGQVTISEKNNSRLVEQVESFLANL